MMYCKHCGAKAEQDHDFCQSCGARLTKATSATAAKKKNYTAIVLSLLAIAVAIVGTFLTIKAIQDNERAALRRAALSASSYSDYYTYTTPLHDYENGTYKVGSTIPAGEYVLFTNSDYGGYFCLSTDRAGDDIIENDNFSYNSIIRINTGEYLELSRCYAVKIDEAGSIPKNVEGAMYKVGTHLPAGEYMLEAVGDYGGYYCVYSDNRQDDIYENENFDDTTWVTVRNGQYLELSRCRITKSY